VATVDGSRTLLRPERIDRAEVIGLAFDEVRQAATSLPVVAVYLLEILRLLDVRAGHHPDVHHALAEQAALIRDGADLGDLLPADAQTIRDAHDQRFGVRR
jgi:uncharacterized membrane protein